MDRGRLLPANKRRSLLLRPNLLLAWLLLAISQAGRAQTTFSFDDALQYVLPATSDAAPTTGLRISYTVFSKQGTIDGATVRVVSVKSPAGQRLIGAEPEVGFGLAVATVTPQGVPLIVTLNPSKYPLTGTYQVLLLFQGKAAGVPISVPTTLQVTRLAPELNVDALKDQVLSLTRFVPFFLPAQGPTATFLVKETSGKAGLSAVQATGDALFVSGKKEREPGSLTVRAKPMQPDGGLPIEVTVEGVRDAGMFDTQLLVSTPGAAGKKAIPIKVQVTDLWIWPFLTILAGVMTAYYFRYLADKRQPFLQNDQLRKRLIGEADRLTPQINNHLEDAQKLTDLRASLTEAEEQNQRDPAVARAILHEVEMVLDALRQVYVHKGIEARMALRSLEGQITAFSTSEGLSADLTTRLQALLPRITATRERLDAGSLNEAGTKLAALQQDFDALRIERFAEVLQEATDNLKSLTMAGLDPDEAKSTQNLIQAAQLLLGSGSFASLPGQLALIQIQLRLLKQKLLAQQQPVSFAGRPEEDDEAPKISLKESTLPHLGNAASPAAILTVPIENQIADIQAELDRNSRALTLIAFLFASVTGMLALYFGNAFGSAKDYLVAFLWGFGIDNSVRGFQSVYQKLTGKA